MNPRTTGILLLVALSLFAFVWFYELGGEGARLEAEERERRLFADVEARDVAWIALTTSDGIDARFEQDAGAWRLVAPLEHAADAAVARMAEALATIPHEAVLENPGSDDEYGLDESAVRVVRFGVGDAEHVLRLGNDTPVGSNLYAKTDGSPSVYTVARHRRSAFERSLTDLREKRILDFDSSAIREVEVRWPHGRVVVERVPVPAAQEGDEEDPPSAPEAAWRMRLPVGAPADGASVDRLLSTLSYLRAADFLDAPTEAHAALLEPPELVVTLRRAAPDFPLTLAVGRVDAEDRRPVRTGEGPPRFRIDADRLDDFPRDASSYRDRTLVALDTGSIDQLDFYFRSAAGDAVALHAKRGEAGEWSAEPESFAEGKLSRIVSELAHLEADTVLAESMGEDDRRGVGLSPPNTILTVLGKTPDATGEGETGLPEQAPVLAEIHLGEVTAEGIVARRAGQDTIYRLAIDVAERLPVTYEAFANRFRAEPAASSEEDAALPAADAGEEWVDPGEESP